MRTAISGNGATHIRNGERTDNPALAVLVAPDPFPLSPVATASGIYPVTCVAWNSLASSAIRSVFRRIRQCIREQPFVRYGSSLGDQRFIDLITEPLTHGSDDSRVV